MVLAGGRSKRFGRDKRFFRLGNKTLLEIAVERLGEVCDGVYIAADSRGITVRGACTLEDEVRYGGPILGIANALKWLGQYPLLTLPVDMPYVDSELLKDMVELLRIHKGKNIALEFKGNILPFPGIYTRDVLDYIMGGGKPFVRGFWEWAVGRRCLLEVAGRRSLRTFTNLNYPPNLE